MPPTFPSHQGLIAPLWRRWPHLFDMPALCVGAAMPDVTDGFIGLFRGHLGQGIGHSLVGLVLLCVPGGVLLWFMVHWAAAHAPTSASSGFLARSWDMGVLAVRHARPTGSFIKHWRRIVAAVFLGAVSHLFFDLISHGKCLLLYPWVRDIPIYPSWWHVAWTHIYLPMYRDNHPVGPHALIWVVLGVAGIVLLFRPVVQAGGRAVDMHTPPGDSAGADGDDGANKKKE